MEKTVHVGGHNKTTESGKLVYVPGYDRHIETDLGDDFASLLAHPSHAAATAKLPKAEPKVNPSPVPDDLDADFSALLAHPSHAAATAKVHEKKPEKTAKEKGTEAYAAGLPNAPMMNPEFMASIKGLSPGVKLQAVKDYTSGWMAANINAPVPELHVGDTKVENGKTFVLNENHHWELQVEQHPEEQQSEKSPAAWVPLSIESLEGAGGKEWKDPKGLKHNVYFNGLKELNGGTYDGMSSGAKVYWNIKAQMWSWKNVQEETAQKIIAKIHAKANEWETTHTITLPDAAAPADDWQGEKNYGQDEPAPEPKPERQPYSPSHGKKLWQPEALEVATYLENTSEGHNKSYEIAITKDPSGLFHLLVKYGKIGGPKTQLEKGEYLDLEEAQAALLDLQSHKMDNNGYKQAPLKASLDGSKWQSIMVPIPAVQEPPKAKDPEPEQPKPATFAASELHKQMIAANPGQKMVFNGIKATRSHPSGKNIIIYKKKEDLTPMSVKARQALAALSLQPKSKKAYLIIPIEHAQAIADILAAEIAKSPIKAPAPAAPKPTAPSPTSYASADTGPKVGDTKVENGQTYRFNANHRWELVEVKAPKAVMKPVTIGKGFNYKQIGPQKGSNEGGLFESPTGKKFYIKFPASEDHAKNEVLASKLYELAGIPGPKLKLVEKDGKIGIASTFQEGLTLINDGKTLGNKKGAAEGFAVDAWLANWDSVGLGNDNLLANEDEEAVRIDVGGSLLFRAQGGPKGDAFGNEVTETKTFLDPSTNPKTAAVFGKMTKAQLIDSVANVLSIDDDIIGEIVQKYGPGSVAEKAKLTAKLIARKADLAKQFPEADLIAHPPMPDPTKLPTNKDNVPGPPNFFNWDGTGKAVSSIPLKNEVNQKALQEIYECALAGNLVALENLHVTVLEGQGPDTSIKSITQHPSGKVQAYYSKCKEFLSVIAYPAGTNKKHFITEDVGDGSAGELSEGFPGHPLGTLVEHVHPNERLGFWISLGTAADPMGYMPEKVHHISNKDVSKGQEDYNNWPQKLKSWLAHVQGSGSNNLGDKNPTEDQKQTIAMAYAHATELEEGTKIFRWLGVPKDMMKQLKAAPDGHVFENPRSTCTSKKVGWDQTPHFDGAQNGSYGNEEGMLMEMIYAKGAKGLSTYGASNHFKTTEQEITSLPGQRYMILKRETHPSGRPKFTVLVLPPDPTYIAALPKVKVA
jgi:hypothetical protein